MQPNEAKHDSKNVKLHVRSCKKYMLQPFHFPRIIEENLGSNILFIRVFTFSPCLLSPFFLNNQVIYISRVLVNACRNALVKIEFFIVID